MGHINVFNSFSTANNVTSLCSLAQLLKSPNLKTQKMDFFSPGLMTSLYENLMKYKKYIPLPLI